MPMIKVSDMAWGRLRSPDLDVAEEFLTRFGLVRVERTPGALYMRGSDPTHHIHVTEKGDPKFVGFAYHAANEEDLARIAKAPGASGIETIDEPGGGRRVRLTEPNGYQIGWCTASRRSPRFRASRARSSTPVQARCSVPASRCVSPRVPRTSSGSATAC